MGDWNRPRHLVLVLAVSSKIKVMCHSCIFIVFRIPSHLQHNMRGVPSTLVPYRGRARQTIVVKVMLYYCTCAK